MSSRPAPSPSPRPRAAGGTASRGNARLPATSAPSKAWVWFLVLVAPRTSRARLVLLAAASLIAPVVLLIETMAGKPVDASAVAGVAGVMFLLVTLRMSGVVRAHQQAVTREQVLRREAAQLVRAPSQAEIHNVTISAVSELVGDNVLAISLATLPAGSGSPAGSEPQAVSGSPDGSGTAGPNVFKVVASSGDQRYIGDIDLGAFPQAVAESLRSGRAVRCSAIDPDVLPAAGRAMAARAHNLFICPLVTTEQLKGVIVVRSVDELPVDVTNTLETLAAQVGMALDREVLTEAFHARRSEARFQTLVQSASDVILIARPDTTITYQTPSTQRILGYGPGAGGRAVDVSAAPQRRGSGGRRLWRRGLPGRDVGHRRVAHPSR